MLDWSGTHNVSFTEQFLAQSAVFVMPNYLPSLVDVVELFVGDEVF